MQSKKKKEELMGVQRLAVPKHILKGGEERHDPGEKLKKIMPWVRSTKHLATGCICLISTVKSKWLLVRQEVGQRLKAKCGVRMRMRVVSYSSSMYYQYRRRICTKYARKCRYQHKIARWLQLYTAGFISDCL